MQNQGWSLEAGYGLGCGLKTSNQSLVSKGVVLDTSIFKLERRRKGIGSIESPVRIQSTLIQSLID